MTVLLTGTRSPATLDLARRLWREGVRVIGADSMRFPLGRFSRAFAAHHRVPSPRFRRTDFDRAILRIVEMERVEWLWPTCEEIFHLAALHETLKGRTRLLFEPLSVLEPLHHKLAFARLAGPIAPDSWLPEEAPRGRSLVWKPIYSRFGARTRFGEPPPSTAGWMAQEFVDGEEFSSWAFCQDGEVRVLVFYSCPVRLGRGAGCAFTPGWDGEAASFVSEFVRARSFTGSIAFDFIRSLQGSLRVIECNPRLTSGIHVLSTEVRISGLFESCAPLPPPMRPSLLRGPSFFVRPRQAFAAPDVIFFREDPGPVLGQVPAFVECAATAFCHRLSLPAAATLDIEYNGD